MMSLIAKCQIIGLPIGTKQLSLSLSRFFHRLARESVSLRVGTGIGFGMIPLRILLLLLNLRLLRQTDTCCLADWFEAYL